MLNLSFLEIIANLDNGNIWVIGLCMRNWLIMTCSPNVSFWGLSHFDQYKQLINKNNCYIFSPCRCPCYCFGASEDSQLKHHHYDDRIHNAKENGYHNKETNKVETENNQHAPNDVHVINNQANNNNEDNVEYYYDTDRYLSNQ